MLEDADADHLVDGIRRNGPEPFGIIDAKGERGRRSSLARGRDHAAGEVDSNAPANPVHEGAQVGAVATSHVEHDIGRGKLGVAVKQSQSVFK